jgi:Fe-S oxidoreductase
MNPGKIVRSPRFDERDLFRYAPDYKVENFTPALDWSDYPGAIGGFQGAAEQCNNNGACRKSEGGGMCPSYRATRDEQHVTRGRANTLRLALSGQIGEGAFSGDAMRDAMKLCVSCKACKRECPTGVDMARMKIEVLKARADIHGFSLRDRLIANLPRYARFAAPLAPLLNLRNRIGMLRLISEKLTGFSARRDLPVWRRDRFAAPGASFGPAEGHEVVLWADSFNAAFEPDILRDGLRLLTAAGYRVHVAAPADGSKRPLCCGRTYLAVGDVASARAEMSRTLKALEPFFARGVPLVGLEPSCLYSFRDEARGMLPGAQSQRGAAHALLLEEFLVREAKEGRFNPAFAASTAKVLLHGHCHQKAFGAMGAVEAALRLVPGLAVETIESSCCGMAGAFGYQAETVDISIAMGELSLLPAVREASSDTLLVADGTSCRHQIESGAGRKAVHVASVLAAALADSEV